MTATEPATSAFVSAATEAPLYEALGTRSRLLARPSDPGGMNLIAIEFLPGGAIPPHHHEVITENVYVISGEVTFRLGDETRVAGPGTLVHLPRGLVHGFSNAGAESAHALLWTNGSGLDLQAIMEVFVSQPAGQPDPAVILPVLEANDMYAEMPGR